MKQADIKTQVRIPEEIHRWLVEQAKGSDRSLNGQIVSILRENMRLRAENQQKPIASG